MKRSQSSSSESALREIDASIAQKRVLVVDDDPVVRSIAAQSLRAIGLDVEEASDGQEALEAVEGSPPDLVILDVEMPRLDGFETCAELRLTSACAEVPVMIATGRTDTETIERAFNCGATDFVTKPLDPQLLQHRARFVLHASMAAVELRQSLAELRRSQERLSAAQRLASIGSWEWLPDDGTMLWSEEMYRILDIDPAPGVSTHATLLGYVHPEDRDEVEKALQSSALEGRSWSLEHRLMLADGERIVFQQAAVRESPLHGSWIVSGTLQDITERRRAEDEIRYLSYYDSVTGLPNRTLFDESFRHALVRARRHESIVGLIYINLDRFKRVNETLGRRAGDELLRIVASRLQTCIRDTDHLSTRRFDSTDSLSRLSGDEFAIALTEMRTGDDAALVAHRVREALRAPIALHGQELVMTAAMGIAIFPDDGNDAEAVLAHATTAMHHAKAEGPDLYRFFNSSMNARALRNLQLEGGLRRALEREEIELHYQPLFAAGSGQITSFEALVRWESQEFGAVSPAEFIPLAEETGLIIPLGEWILREACRQHRVWQVANLDPVPIAVNVSSLQFGEQALVEMVRRALREFELEPSAIELELTESALFGDDPRVIRAMRSLKELGIRLALDDFGTGYSSLSYLVRFPIDKIKIDRSFVQNVGSDLQANAMIAAVVAMARRLGLSVTAEGVETEAQQAFLGSEGCDTLQGYLLGRPLDATASARLLAERGPRR